MSEQKQVKFTWYPDGDDDQLKLSHDNRIQGVAWQRVTDCIVALKQCGFLKTVYRQEQDDKAYTFLFHEGATLDNLRFCQQYIESTISALPGSWYAGMRLAPKLAERLVVANIHGPAITEAIKLLRNHASNLQTKLDAGTINYREAFDSLAAAVKGTTT